MTESEDKAANPPADVPETSWQYQADGQDTPPDAYAPAPLPDIDSVTWTGDEFVAHHRTAGWYGTLGAGAGVFALLVYLLTKDWVSAGVVIIVAIVFMVFASRKPRKLEYVIDQSGVHIGPRLHPYDGFKSFSLVEEDSAQAVWLMPLKRFMPIITVYFEMKDGQKIVDALSRVLPLEDRQPGLVDHLMHRLKF